MEIVDYFCKRYKDRFGIESLVGDEKERLQNFLTLTKNYSIEELKELYSFFECASNEYDNPRCNLECYRFGLYLYWIIYIKENLEIINNDRLEEMDIEFFEFYMKRMYKGILLDMDRYFEMDLMKLTDEVVKKYELKYGQER